MQRFPMTPTLWMSLPGSTGNPVCRIVLAGSPGPGDDSVGCKIIVPHGAACGNLEAE
jgi:hypothetical protein